jgi:uncharacterized MAPEG superfamily protein
MFEVYYAVLGYAFGLLLLTVLLLNVRGFAIFFQGKAVNSFKPDGDDISAFSQRICRARSNYYENFPVFAGIVLAAFILNKLPLLGPLAKYFIISRYLQTTAHLISTSQVFVWLRFIFYFVQVAISAYWLYILMV